MAESSLQTEKKGTAGLLQDHWKSVKNILFPDAAVLGEDLLIAIDDGDRDEALDLISRGAQLIYPDAPSGLIYDVIHDKKFGWEDKKAIINALLQAAPSLAQNKILLKTLEYAPDQEEITKIVKILENTANNLPALFRIMEGHKGEELLLYDDKLENDDDDDIKNGLIALMDHTLLHPQDTKAWPLIEQTINALSEGHEKTAAALVHSKIWKNEGTYEKILNDPLSEKFHLKHLKTINQKSKDFFHKIIKMDMSREKAKITMSAPVDQFNAANDTDTSKEQYIYDEKKKIWVYNHECGDKTATPELIEHVCDTARLVTDLTVFSEIQNWLVQFSQMAINAPDDKKIELWDCIERIITVLPGNYKQEAAYIITLNKPTKEHHDNCQRIIKNAGLIPFNSYVGPV